MLKYACEINPELIDFLDFFSRSATTYNTILTYYLCIKVGQSVSKQYTFNRHIATLAFSLNCVSGHPNDPNLAVAAGWVNQSYIPENQNIELKETNMLWGGHIWSYMLLSYDVTIEVLISLALSWIWVNYKSSLM